MKYVRTGSLAAAIVVMAVALVIEGPAATAASSGAPASSASTFYAGKQLRFVVPGRFETAGDFWAREVAPLMGRFLHAQVTVSDDGGVTPLNGQSQLASAPPDGLTFGELDLSYDFSLLIPRSEPLPFNLGSFGIVAVTGPAASLVWCAVPSFPDHTFAELIRSRTHVLISDSINDQLSNVIVRAVDAIFGVNGQVVNGFATAAYVVAGFESGDTPLAAAPISNFLSLIVAGKARPLLTLTPFGQSDSNSGLSGVPTLAEYAKQHSPTSKAMQQALGELLDLATSLTGWVLAVPRGVPTDRLEMLTSAFRSAMSQIAPGQAVLSGESAVHLYEQALDNAGSLRLYAAAG